MARQGRPPLSAPSRFNNEIRRRPYGAMMAASGNSETGPVAKQLKGCKQRGPEVKYRQLDPRCWFADPKVQGKL